MGGLWRRYRGWPKWVRIAVPVVVVLIVIGAASGGSKKKPETATQKAAASAAVKSEQAAKAKSDAEKKVAAAAAKRKEAAAEAAKNKITGRVNGSFDRSCTTCAGDPDGSLEGALTTTDVWCAWQDGHVVVHVTMRNRVPGHITVTWLPIYEIKNGGIHGDDVLKPQNSGFDAGQTRSLLINQSPKGIIANAPISVCQPSFFDIKNG